MLGDALGLTAVHVNRVLRKLRVSGVMDLTAGSLTYPSSRTSPDLTTTIFTAGYGESTD